MADLFRNAMSFIGRESPSQNDSPLIGTTIQVGKIRLVIRRKIGTGGFADVFAAQDDAGQWFAVKRQMVIDAESTELALNEIRTAQKLSGPPSIVKFVEGAKKSPPEGSRGATEFLMVSELCSGGVVDLLKKNDLEHDQILRIAQACADAIHEMHKRSPAITHRDIKVENLLIGQDSQVKLCDFGSSTTDFYIPDYTMSASERTRIEELYQKHTTPMYRPPEILETYNDYPIGPQMDIWAFGCVLFYLCYRVHPFEDSAKLRIVNGRYVYPKDVAEHKNACFNAIIDICLKLDPSARPDSDGLVSLVENLGRQLNIKTRGPVAGTGSQDFLAGLSVQGGSSRASPSMRDSAVPPARPPPPAARVAEDSMSAPPTSAMLGAIKGQGLSFLKNMKDKTTAVVQTVQSTYGKGPELYPITTRFLFTVQPVVPDALAAQAEEALRNHLNETGKKYMVVNLNPRKLRSEAFRHPPIHSPFMPLSSGVPPTLNQLLDLCLQILNFLRQDKESMIVVHGVQEHVFLVSAAVLLFFRLVTRPFQCFEMISEVCALSPQLPPSYHRALDLVALVSGPDRQTLRKQITSRTIILKSLAIEPIPLFNTAVTGCRPFVEIYAGGSKVWSMPGEFNSHRSFELPTDTSIEIPIDSVLAFDDVTVVVQHVSYSRLQGKTNLVTMMSFGFHANFFSREQNNLLVFRHGDLDAPNGKIEENTRILLGLSCAPVDRGFADESELPYFLKIDMNGVRPTFLTSTSAEYDKYAHKYLGQGISAVSAPPTICTAKSNNSESVAPKRDDFFGSLSWDATAQKPSTRNVDLLQDQDSNSQRDVAEQSERLAGIRVGQVEEDHDADQYKFDYEKNETPIMGQNSPVTSQQMPEVDLLGLGEPVVSAPTTQPKRDPLNELFDPFTSSSSMTHSSQNVNSSQVPTANNDLLDWSDIGSSTNIHRNVSAPNFPSQKPVAAAFDPFADFLAASSHSNPPSKGGSTTNSGSTTPAPVRPNYSRAAFDFVGAAGTTKKPSSANTFGDLLSGHGFSSTGKNANQTIADMRRADEIRDMDPVSIKIRDWTKGKEKNIRALLASLNDVLWEGAARWNQPSMADLLQPDQIKKCYRKACLVVHPDKQVGAPHEQLAKAIFRELNDGWTEFEKSGMSL